MLPKHKEIIYINEDKLENCSICYEVKCELKTKCEHTFCEKCLETWLNNNTSCPFCRENLSNSSFYCIKWMI